MAVSFSTRKCDSCGGSLMYDRAKKVWICRYCGQETVREEKYDGLFTIKNVARQAIIDAAYRRIGQAEKNISECEKIDARYVGTVIARICYRLTSVITPGACRAEEVRGMYQRLKDDYQYLKSLDDAISEEEESFYEFLNSADSASDAFAVLIVVFDTLGDAKRPEYLLELIETGSVYSKECNKDLLAYSLKTQRTDMAKAIIANRNNIDIKSSLDVVLERCPDGDGKAEMAVSLLEAGAYDGTDRDKIQNYIHGQDSCGTKAQVIGACGANGTMPPMEDLIQYVLANATAEEMDAAMKGICNGRIIDSELYTLLDYALCETLEKAADVLDAIHASGQYMVIGLKHMKTVFLGSDRPAEERIALWDKVQQFEVDAKSQGAVLNDYLCSSKDDAEGRMKILDLLLTGLKTISPSTLDRYLLNCTADGENKPVILQRILAMEDVRPAYFGDSLGKYIKKSPDDADVRKGVVDALLDAGFTLDPNSINDFICSTGASAKDKVELLRRLEQNHCYMRADALSVYLEKCADRYEEELFVYLFEKSTVISEAAIRNFVLVCGANAATKAQNAAALAGKQSTPFGASACQVIHLSHRISCNLAQAYLLTTGDCYETASALLREMTTATRITSDIMVDGMSMKMKKYVKDNRARLTPMVQQLCEDNRMFSLF